MKRSILIMLVMAVTLSSQAQFVFKSGKATAKMDSLVSNGNAVVFRNKLTGSMAYFRTSGDSLFFGDVNGEKYMGDGGGGSVVSGSLLKAVGGSLEPYANQGEAPQGAFYYSGEGYRLDTSLYIIKANEEDAFKAFNSVGNAIVGQSTSYGVGVIASSETGTAFVASTNSGFNHARFGNTGDSLTIRSDATIRQSNSGVTKLYTDTNGYIHNLSPYASIYRNTDLGINFTQNAWAKITGFTTGKNVGCTIAGDSARLINAGSYTITATISMLSNGFSDDVWELAVFKNGVMAETSQLATNNGEAIFSFSVTVNVDSDGTDWVSFKVRNISSDEDPTFKRFSAIINSIHLNL